ncbi:class C sortase [Macrococcus lamae]|uniref:Class C sortase n=1 Tax=Macrococcus lamae TaxID=198484 RepID=A0A4R6BVH3_9STAP|nr:class C sortase [Macrococcus lamae]TDM12284.1 class C sortase [Macrococcus lamae]
MRRGLAVILFLVGLVIFSYPLIAKVYYNYNMSNQSDAMDEQFQVESKDQKIKYSQFRDYNRQIAEGQSIESPAVKVKKNDTSDEQMMADDVIATVKIPALKLHYPVYDQATPENLDRGVSRVAGTSFPVGGRSTNSVLAAHSYSPYHEWFTHIDRLKNGDKIIVNNFKETLYYKVFDRIIVMPDQVEAMAVRKGKDILTLLTCTPSGKERLLIYAERTTKDGATMKPEVTKAEPVKELSLVDRLKVLSESWFVILFAVTLTAMFINMLIHSKYKN